MSDDDRDEPLDEEGTTPSETPTDTPSEESGGGTEPAEEDGPELDEDDQAFIPDDLTAEEIEEETEDTDADETDEDTSDESESTEEGDEKEESGSNDPAPGSGASLGEAYATFLQSVTPALIEAIDDDAEANLDDDHFREASLGGQTLPEHFDALAEKRGFGSDLSPEQAVVILTLVAVGEPMLDQTDAVSQAIDGATEAA